MAKKSDIRLGQLLVQRKLCTLQQVNEALLKQKNLKSRNQAAFLGEILCESGVLRQDVLFQVLAEIGAIQLFCPVCRIQSAVDSYVPGSAQICGRCGAKLVLDDVPAALEDAPAEPRKLDAPAPRREAERLQEKTAQRAALTRMPEAAPSADPCIGKVLGGCQILEKIGHGGMGMVYKAKQLNLGRIVAVKVLSKELANDAMFVRRFIQEARSAAQLSHGNIVHVNDVGECQGVFYFVMEYVDGSNVKEMLKTSEKLDVQQTVEIALQVCQALRHAHNRGIIHRDIKPENIMITRDGVVKLADLGLAKRMAAETAAGITHAGAILGTPFYMAPEQAKDFSKVDRRSDIYSLGVTLYRMLTGRVPFDGRSPIEVMINALDGRKIPVRELREDVPIDLEAVVDRMMHKLPEKRYQDVDEVLRDLTKVLNSLPVGQTA